VRSKTTARLGVDARGSVGSTDSLPAAVDMGRRRGPGTSWGRYLLIADGDINV
jgi:hypothetical protein